VEARRTVLADAPDQVLPAAAEPVAGLRGGLGQRGGGYVEQRRAVQGGGELGGQDVEVGAIEVQLAQQVADVLS
jgi:hypothetical protein